MLLAVILCAAFIVYICINVALVAVRNRKAHKFYATKAPNLPIYPKKPRLFSGHIYDLTIPRKNHKILRELHKELGPTYGFYVCDQPWVATIDIDLIKCIEVDQGHKHINRAIFGVPVKHFNESIFQKKDDEWRRVRRAIAPALTSMKVRSNVVTDDVRRNATQLRDAIEHRRRKTQSDQVVIDVSDLFKRYTLSVIFLTGFKQEDIIDWYADKDVWVEAFLNASMQVVNPFVQLGIMFPFLRSTIDSIGKLHAVGKIDSVLYDFLTKALDAHKSALDQHVKSERRLSTLTGRKERKFSDVDKSAGFTRRLVDNVIDLYMEKKITHTDFMSSMIFLVLAGFETTADTLTCLSWHLAHKPHIQDKFRQAILDEGIEAEYVHWCIMETVRWHPAVPLGTGRVLSHDINVNGLYLPKDTFIMVNTTAIHHNESIWPRASEFLPERWQDASTFHPAAFVGFGLGPRNCVGAKLAMHEIKLVMRELLAHYRIEVCDETCSSYEFSSPGLIFTTVDEPIKLRFKRIECD